MIEITLPSLREKKKTTTYPMSNYGYKPPQYTPRKTYPSDVTPISDLTKKQSELRHEALRRDQIIRNLNKEIKYKEGDRVSLASDAAAAKYGKEIYVTKIVTSYAQMGKDEEWPASDCPMIVSCYSKDKDTNFICTPHYILPL